MRPKQVKCSSSKVKELKSVSSAALVTECESGHWNNPLICQPSREKCWIEFDASLGGGQTSCQKQGFLMVLKKVLLSDFTKLILFGRLF